MYDVAKIVKKAILESEGQPLTDSLYHFHKNYKC